MTDFTPLTACLTCGSTELQPYFDGGCFPSANDYRKPGDKPPPAYPLGLSYCRVCMHSQQPGFVDPSVLYLSYAYASGTSQTLADYFAQFVEKVEAQYPGKKLRVLDIACNDGSLLKVFQKRGHKVQGVDPATNLNDGSVPILNTFWGMDAIRMLPTNGGIEPYDVIVCMNVLGHCPDPFGFLMAAKHVLAPGGRIYAQTSQAKMIEDAQIDNAYSEHISFFNVRSFLALADRAELYVDEVKHVDIHGTSYLVEMTGDYLGPQEYEDHELGWSERLRGYYSPLIYNGFERKVAQHVDHVKRTIAVLEDAGYAPVLFGAAAKAITFASYADLKFAVVIDDSPLKQGKVCPGLGNVVFSFADFIDHVDDPWNERILWILGAWNIRAEIIAKIKRARPGADDKFMVYYPNVEVFS